MECILVRPITGFWKTQLLQHLLHFWSSVTSGNLLSYKDTLFRTHTDWLGIDCWLTDVCLMCPSQRTSPRVTRTHFPTKQPQLDSQQQNKSHIKYIHRKCVKANPMPQSSNSHSSNKHISTPSQQEGPYGFLSIPPSEWHGSVQWFSQSRPELMGRIVKSKFNSKHLKGP